MASTDNRIALVENDTADIILCQFQDTDITGWTFYLKLGYRNSKPLVKEGTITSAATGEFQFEFAFGDLRPESVAAELLTVDATGKQKTFQGLYVDISARLKASP